MSPPQVAVITGAGRGIGRATALRLARAGCDVGAAARTHEQLIETQRAVEAVGRRCEVVRADVTDADQVAALVSRCVETLGRIDMWVNNAGIAPQGTIAGMDTQTFDGLLAVNVRAVFLCCRAAWPVMRRQGGGVIINISSMAAVDPFAGFAAYGASKAWVNLFTAAAAREGRADGIRVYAVAPGAVETRLLRGNFPDYPADRTLDPDAVAGVVELLADPRAAHASGSVVYVRK